MNAIIQWLDDPRSIRLGLTLVHFLWQGALLGAAASLVMIWMRSASSHRRYAVLLTVLLAMAIAPVVTFIMLPAPPTNTEPMAAVAVARAPLAPDRAPASPVPAAPTRSHSSTTPYTPLDKLSQTNSDVAASETGLPARVRLAWQWTEAHLSWFVAAWALGVCLFSLRLIAGFRGARRVRCTGIERAPDPCRAQCGDLAKRLGLRRVANVCQSTLVKVPVVVGWLKPIVLLPASVIAGLPEPELRAILAHELAHIRRHDYLVNVLQTIVETLLFYHPAVWRLSSAIRQEREQCCDDLAAEACGDKLVVAKALVRLAEVRALPAAPAMAATGGRLARRIRRLLLRASDTNRPTAWRSSAGSCLAILLTLAVVLAVNILSGELTGQQAVAQESKPIAQDAQKSNEADELKRQAERFDQLFFEKQQELLRIEQRQNKIGETHGADPKPGNAWWVRYDRLREQERAEIAKLEGRWKIVAAQFYGEDFSKLYSHSPNWRFLRHEIWVDEEKPGSSNNYYLFAVAGENVNFYINPRKKEKQMTVMADGGDRLLSQAIYRLEGDTLTICFFWWAAADDWPTSFTPAKDETLPRGVFTLRRVQDESNDAEKPRRLKHEPQPTKAPAEPRSDLGSRNLKPASDGDSRQIRRTQLRDSEQADAAKLEGTWKVSGLQIDGKDGPVTGSRNWVFRGRQVAVNSAAALEKKPVPPSVYPVADLVVPIPDDPLATRTPPANDAWKTFFLNPIKTEKQMTIVGESMLIQAIYRLDGDTLTISYFGRSEADRPTSFTATKDDLLPHLVWTLRRVDSESKQSH